MSFRRLILGLKEGYEKFSLRTILFYKLILVLEFTFIFIFLVYSSEFYTTLKLWLMPPFEHRVEVTAVAEDTELALTTHMKSLKGQELVVLKEGIVVYVPIVSTESILVKYPGGSVHEFLSHEKFAELPIARIISPLKKGEYRTWLLVYRKQSSAILF